MKILVVTKEGDSAPLVFRLQSEGHEVRLLQMKKEYASMLSGLVEKLEAESEIEVWKPELIVNLETKLKGFTEKWKEKGFRVLGGSAKATWLEENRYGALKFAQDAGVLIPDTLKAKDTGEAIKLMKESDLRRCVKFNQDGGEKFLSFLGKSNDDVIHFIEQKYKPENKGMILQEYIEGPAEVNVEGWFSQGELIWPMIGGIEQKRFLAGDMGPNTGCMSTLTWPLSSDSLTPWTTELLTRLKNLKYSGPLDMAFKVSQKNELYFLEFTPRLGINAGFGLIDLMEEDLGKFFDAVEKGTATEMQIRPEFDFLLTISVYPYPYEISKVYVPGMEVKVEEVGEGNIWWQNVQMEGNKLVTAEGQYTVVCHTSAWDQNPRKAIQKSHQIAESIEVTGKQYRTDHDEVLEDLKLVKNLGIK